MKVLVLTHGTRGDVQPYLALARALEEAGHTAAVAGPAAAAPLAAEHGVAYRPVDDGPNRLMTDDPDLDGVMDTGLRGVRGKVEAVKLLRRIKPLMRRVFEDMADAADDGADIVVHNPGMPGGHIAERLGVPSVLAPLQPTWVPTGAFPAAGLPLPRLPAALNRATYRIMPLVLRGQYAVVDAFREERLGLSRRAGRHDLLRQADGRPSTVVQGFSRHLLPERLDYPGHVHTTGFWFLRAASGWTPPAALADFLAAGEPPVFIGFSSLPSTDPGHLGRVVAGAVRRAGTRAVVASGWGGIDGIESDDRVLLIDQAPHDWLFPRCSAIVHHGGGGTTGAALASGRPQVVCPFWGDQPFWAERAHAAGVAVAPQRGQRLTAESLATAVGRAVSDPALIAGARAVGERARTEEGTAAAVRILEQVHRRAAGGG